MNLFQELKENAREESLNELSQKALVQKAIDIATSMGGNMTGAVKRIEKIKRNLSKDKNVANALRLANEETVSENADMVIHVDDKLQTNLVTKMASKFGLTSKKTKISWSGKDGVVVSGDANKLKKFMSSVEDVFKEETITENYRKLAKHGMGTETPKSIKVGTEIDYYQKDGAKYMGKVTKMSKQSYTVRDDKTKKDHEFFYHDRIKAAKLLKQGDNVQEGKGTDIFQKYSKVISRLSSKEQDEILDALYTMNTQSGGKTKEAHSKVKELLNLDYTPEGDNIQEKVEYAEYKFRNKRDAQKALDYFKSQQLIDLNINDDGLSQFELAIDAGTKDMTKYHKEVLKKFKPKVLTTEMASAQQAAIAIAKKKKNESVMDAYREMWEEKLDEEMISYRVKKMQKPEEDKFNRSAKMMGLKITMDKGRDDTVIVMSGTKKKLRDFDAVARGKSSYGDPSTISHFDEK